MDIFTDKSIVKQEQCVINDGVNIFNGVSIIVEVPKYKDGVEIVFKRDELQKAMLECDGIDTGKDRLLMWFELSYASFLTLPRVLMNEMPDEWQNNMGALLEEYDDMYPNQPNLGTRVQATKGGQLTKMPEFLKNYRHPDHCAIEKLKKDSE